MDSLAKLRYTAPIRIYRERLQYNKIRKSGCAPMSEKCRLHSNRQSKFSYDVTDYWRKLKWQRCWWEAEIRELQRLINTYNMQYFPQHVLLCTRTVHDQSELKTLEWWISGIMLNPLFFLISRLNIACSSQEFNLQIN